MIEGAPLVHVVLFALPGNAEAAEAAALMDDIDRILRPLPTVKELWRGTPADTKTPDRPMVDKDYDVGLMVLFENRAALEEYLAHPDHVVFAEKWDTRCRLRVFDFQ